MRRQHLTVVTQHLSRLYGLRGKGLPENSAEALLMLKEVWAICAVIPYSLEAIRSGVEPGEPHFDVNLRDQRERLLKETEGTAAGDVGAALRKALDAYALAVDAVLDAGQVALNPFLVGADTRISDSASTAAFEALPYLLVQCQIASTRIQMLMDAWGL